MAWQIHICTEQTWGMAASILAAENAILGAYPEATFAPAWVPWGSEGLMADGTPILPRMVKRAAYVEGRLVANIYREVAP